MNNTEIIGMCHLSELPGDPNFKSGLDKTINLAKKDIETLQSNGVNKILFSNEFSYPYTNNVEPVTSMSMAYVIGTLKNILSVPFGVDCMYDSISTKDLAIATEANFYRITLSKSTNDKYYLGETNIGSVIRRHKESIKISKLLLNVSIPLEIEIKNSSALQFISTIVTQVKPYCICVSSSLLFDLIDKNLLNNMKMILGETKLYCDGGCNKSNINTVSENVDGVIIGKSFKENEILNNPVSFENVQKIVKSINK